MSLLLTLDHLAPADRARLQKVARGRGPITAVARDLLVAGLDMLEAPVAPTAPVAEEPVVVEDPAA